MRSLLANLRNLTLPFGAGTGKRIVLSGVLGLIRFYNALNELRGELGPDLWYIGNIDGARAQLDPAGGFRITNEDGTLVALFDPTQGLQLRDGDSGIIQVEVTDQGIVFRSTDGTESIVMGTTPGLPTPRWAATPTETGAAGNVLTPAVESFGSGTDFELRHAALFQSNGDLTGNTYTTPVGYTEQLDETNHISIGNSSLAIALASRDPALPNGIRTFDYSDNVVGRALGTTVLIQGDGVTTPSIRDINTGFFSYSSPTVDFTITRGDVAQDDIILVFVTFANDGGGLPSTWTTPRGYGFLGGAFASATTPLAAGVWAHLAGASEPTSETIRISKIGGESPTQIHWAVVTIQDAKLLPEYVDLRISGVSIPRGGVIPLTSSTSDSVALDIVGRIRTLPGTPVTVTNNTGGTRRYRATAFMRFRMDAGTNGLYRPLVTNGLDGASGVALSVGPAQVFTTVTGAAGEVGSHAEYEFTLAPGASQDLGAGGLRVAGGSATDDIRLGYIYVDDIGE